MKGRSEWITNLTLCGIFCTLLSGYHLPGPSFADLLFIENENDKRNHELIQKDAGAQNRVIYTYTWIFMAKSNVDVLPLFVGGGSTIFLKIFSILFFLSKTLFFFPYSHLLQLFLSPSFLFPPTLTSHYLRNRQRRLSPPHLRSSFGSLYS